MSDAGPSNPLVQQLDLLLNGRGFNYYKAENRARADDLLVRERAAGALSAAIGTLSSLHGAYYRQYIPAPSRENPARTSFSTSCSIWNRSSSSRSASTDAPTRRG